MPRGNADNLGDFRELTAEEQREIARKGGIASGEARRAKKELREIAEQMLELAVNAGETGDLEFINDSNKNLTAAQKIILEQIVKALKGDTKAAEFVRDTAGQKPTDKIEHDIKDYEINIKPV